MKRSHIPGGLLSFTTSITLSLSSSDTVDVTLDTAESDMTLFCSRWLVSFSLVTHFQRCNVIKGVTKIFH